MHLDMHPLAGREGHDAGGTAAGHGIGAAAEAVAGVRGTVILVRAGVHGAALVDVVQLPDAAKLTIAAAVQHNVPDPVRLNARTWIYVFSTPAKQYIPCGNVIRVQV